MQEEEGAEAERKQLGKSRAHRQVQTQKRQW